MNQHVITLAESEVKVVVTDKIQSGKVGFPTKTEMKHEQVRKLAAQGCSTKGIARQLKMHRQTVKKYMQMENPPRKFYGQHMELKGPLSNEQRVYLAKRWKEADVNARQLWQELKEQGYEGSSASIYRAVAHFPAHHKESVGTKKAAKESIPALSSRLGMWLLVKPREKLSDKDQDVLLKLLDNHPQAAIVYPLVQDFISMAKKRKSDHLYDWISRTRESGVTQLAQFASVIKRDYGAVKAGLSMEWSNGQVEGQITHLKLIKRLGYGGANLDLLKKRVLYKPFAQVA